MTLYAKSGKKQTLEEHLKNVLQAAQRFAFHTKDVLFESEDEKNLFERSLYLAAAYHDVGKATTIFQDALKHNPQSIKHELVSAYVIARDILPFIDSKEDLEDFEVQAYLIAFIAIANHHRRANELSIYIPYTYHDISQILLGKIKEETIQFEEKFEFTHSLIEPEKVAVSPEDTKTLGEIIKVYEECFKKAEPVLERYNNITKTVIGFLIASDIHGSVASFTIDDETLSLEEYIDKCFAGKCTRDIIDVIITTKLNGGNLHPYQKEVSEIKKNLLLSAPCGTGKTIAALNWIRGNLDKPRKVFFCLPTTGTTTANYMDYYHKYGFSEAGIIHSRVSVDFADSPDAQYDSKAFAHLDKPIVICTVDTILSSMQGDISALNKMPYFADSLFVFDEVHMYDPKMLGALVEFSEFWSKRGAKVMWMSATLHHGWKNLFEEKLDGEVIFAENRTDPPFDSVNSKKYIICVDKKQVEIPQYMIYAKYLASYTNAKRYNVTTELKKSTIKEITNDNNKILVVANSVNSAIDYTEQFAKHIPEDFKIICYHSRFKYHERSEVLKEIVNIKPEDKVIVFATQVAEVSLDLDFDCLVTELCPPDAFIQRLGRVNRQHSIDKVPRIYIVKQNKRGPYDELDMDCGQRFINYLLSDEELGKPLEKKNLFDITLQVLWRDFNGVFPKGIDFRIPGYTVTCIDKEDKNKEDKIAFEIPLPKYMAHNGEKCKNLYVVNLKPRKVSNVNTFLEGVIGYDTKA